jgi:hypothetical protein
MFTRLKPKYIRKLKMTNVANGNTTVVIVHTQLTYAMIYTRFSLKAVGCKSVTWFTMVQFSSIIGLKKRNIIYTIQNGALSKSSELLESSLATSI